MSSLGLFAAQSRGVRSFSGLFVAFAGSKWWSGSLFSCNVDQLPDNECPRKSGEARKITNNCIT